MWKKRRRNAVGDEEEESKKVMGYYGGCVLYLRWCKSLTPTGQWCVGESVGVGGGGGGDAVGGGNRWKGKKSQHKFSPGQTNENSLIHDLARSIFFFFWSWMWSGLCFPAEAPPRPRAPVPFSSRGPHPQTIPIKPRPLLNPSFFPISSQMTNNMTFGTKVQIYSLWSNTTTFSHWKKIINKDLVQ